MRFRQSTLGLAFVFLYLPFLFLEAFVWTLRMTNLLSAGGAPGMLDTGLPTWLAFISQPLFGLIVVCGGIALVAVSGRAAGDDLALEGQASTTETPDGFPWFSSGGITILASLVAITPLLWNSLVRERVGTSVAMSQVSSPPSTQATPPAQLPSRSASIPESQPKETWKPLTATQQAHLALLFTSKKGSVHVVSIPQDDAFALAKGLHMSFRQAGWVMEKSSVDFFMLKNGPAQLGKVCVVVSEPQNGAATRIQSALKEVLNLEPCTRINRTQGEDDVTIEVWPKN